MCVAPVWPQGPLGHELLELQKEREWEAEKEEIFKDTPDCLRCDKCTCQRAIAWVGVPFLVWWMWMNRVETVALKMP